MTQPAAVTQQVTRNLAKDIMQPKKMLDSFATHLARAGAGGALKGVARATAQFARTVADPAAVQEVC